MTIEVCVRTKRGTSFTFYWTVEQAVPFSITMEAKRQALALFTSYKSHTYRVGK